jgi:hypothetical protein
VSSDISLDIRKNKRRLKEHTDNRIFFSYYRMSDHVRPIEEEGDDKLIKRAFQNWNTLRTPAFHKQTALFTMTKNFMEERILKKLENIRNVTNEPYIKLCNTCLQEEDGIVHKMIECPPVCYINNTIAKAVSLTIGFQLDEKTTNKKPCNLTRFIVFMDLPAAVRQNQNKESGIMIKAMVAVSNIATATARQIWLQNHIRKPTIERTQQLCLQTMQSVKQCYHNKKEYKILSDTMSKVTMFFNEDIENKIEVNYEKPSIQDKFLVEETQIPTFIYEQSQGDALIRTIQIMRNEQDAHDIEIQKSVDIYIHRCLKSYTAAKRIKYYSRLAIRYFIQAAAILKRGENFITMTYLLNKAFRYKQKVREIKHNNPSLPSKRELAELAANVGEAIEKQENKKKNIGGDEILNLHNKCRMTFRKQLRVSHLSILEGLKKKNTITKERQLQKLEW